MINDKEFIKKCSKLRIIKAMTDYVRLDLNCV